MIIGLLDCLEVILLFDQWTNKFKNNLSFNKFQITKIYQFQRRGTDNKSTVYNKCRVVGLDISGFVGIVTSLLQHDHLPVPNYFGAAQVEA